MITTKAKPRAPRKPKFLYEDSATYERLANQLARTWVIINPCSKCGGPVIQGYCCDRCGSTSP